jgi:hypothetical protein
MNLRVVRELCCIKQACLVFLFVRTIDAKVRFELLVKAFGLTVRLRVESCTHPMLSAQDMGKICLIH